MVDLEDIDPPICEYCGMPIEEHGQECAGLDDGVCDPDPYGVY